MATGYLAKIIQSLMETPRQTYLTKGGLALGYNQVNGTHILKLSRLAVYPSEVEVQVVRNILTAQGFEDITHKMEASTPTWHTITLCFPVGKQLRL